MVNNRFEILNVFTGSIAPLTNQFKSAISKHPKARIVIRQHAIDDDEIANRVHHGGTLRVVHHYTQEHYNYFKRKFPEIAARFVPGSFGENILTEELTEAQLNVGDIFSLGSAKVQVTVPRRPCATINYAYQNDCILAEVMKTARTGWFYRVLEEGEVGPGDYLELLERPFPNLSLLKLLEQGYGQDPFSEKDFLKECLNTNLMDKNWRAKIELSL